jgi:hypothetical protein
MRRIVRRTALTAGLVGTALAVAVPVATAGPSASPVTVKGAQIEVDLSKGLYEMRGSLVGKWSITAWVPRYTTASHVVGTGKERFVGCHDTSRNGTCEPSEPTGTLRFVFTYWATMDPTTKALLKGQCVHPVIGGTGDFANAKGIINMTDRQVGSAVRTTYAGTLEYPNVTTTSAEAAPAERTLAGRTSAPRSCGG